MTAGFYFRFSFLMLQIISNCMWIFFVNLFILVGRDAFKKKLKLIAHRKFRNFTNKNFKGYVIGFVFLVQISGAITYFHLWSPHPLFFNLKIRRNIFPPILSQYFEITISEALETIKFYWSYNYGKANLSFKGIKTMNKIYIVALAFDNVVNPFYK